LAVTPCSVALALLTSDMRNEYVPRALLAFFLTSASLMASAIFTFTAATQADGFAGLMGQLDLGDLASVSQDGSTYSR